MDHSICDACETCAWCMRNGCIPITREPEPPSSEKFAIPADRQGFEPLGYAERS